MHTIIIKLLNSSGMRTLHTQTWYCEAILTWRWKSVFYLKLADFHFTGGISKESDRKKSIARHFALNENPPQYWDPILEVFTLKSIRGQGLNLKYLIWIIQWSLDHPRSLVLRVHLNFPGFFPGMFSFSRPDWTENVEPRVEAGLSHGKSAWHFSIAGGILYCACLVSSCHHETSNSLWLCMNSHWVKSPRGGNVIIVPDTLRVNMTVWLKTDAGLVFPPTIKTLANKCKIVLWTVCYIWWKTTEARIFTAD